MVANKPFGVDNKASVVSADLLVPSPIDSLSEGVSEKNATSAPEISAEQANKISKIPNEIENGTQLMSARTSEKVCSKLFVFVQIKMVNHLLVLCSV